MAIEYIRAARVQELSDRRGKLVCIEDEDVALFKVDGTVYALSNLCVHQHFSALHQWEVNGLRVSCAMHGWTYSLIIGIVETGNGKVKAYPMRVEGENVFVGVER